VVEVFRLAVGEMDERLTHSSGDVVTPHAGAKILRVAPNEYAVTARARVNAPPERVYAIIADYRVGHPAILPKQFTSLVVETGGTGAGTVIRCELRVLGQKQAFRAAVTEPQPGRVLVETIIEGDPLVTSFTVDPADGGRASEVTISSVITRKPGVRGIIERFLSPRILAPMYRDELQLLNEYATRP
jgi:hypothetical protein